MSDKIENHHLQRKALLYVRQSSPQQVVNNEESQRLQYAMQERLVAFGWQEIVVIDEDLGISAGGTAVRAGFERMVAEVCLGKVGAVAAREVSRFARNSREWQQLVEMCRTVGTLLIDHEAIYDPRRTNDRLLLGLKGTMNEYELDLLRLRSFEARWAKARRGELWGKVPPGYVKMESRIEKDPNQRTQKAVELVFKKFIELGSARQTHEWFVDNDLELPQQDGAQTRWGRASYAGITRMLKNPTYAGAYAYGRTKTTAQLEDGRIRRVRKSVENYPVLLQDQHEAYIEWEQFIRIQNMLKANRQKWGEAVGAAKKGNALLPGLLRCRRCGRKLAVNYRTERSCVRYQCSRGPTNLAEPMCIGFGGQRVDENVARAIIDVVQSGAVEAALAAERETEQSQNDLQNALDLELTGAKYAAERAKRHVENVDPENRLVAAELERRWEATLQKVHDLEQRLAKAKTTTERVVPNAAVLTTLAKDLGRVWNDPNTDVRLKKRIVRTLLEEIVVDVDNERSIIDLVLHWKGGVHTQLKVAKLNTGQKAADSSPDVVEIIRQLALVSTDKSMAIWLARNKIQTPRSNRWTWKSVAQVRNYREFPPASEQPEGKWLTLRKAAALIGMTKGSLQKAAQKGLITVIHPLPLGPWIFDRAHLDEFRTARTLEMNGRGQSPQLSLKISGVSEKSAV